jgi:predicted transcriptional regulator
MSKPAFDADALIAMFESATATQSEQLRQAVGQATLAALQGRELTLKNIRQVLKTVTDAAGAGLAKNPLGADVAPLLDQAVAGMDDALLKAVEANRVALQQLLAQGADLRDKHLKKALDDLDKIEDTLIAAVKKGAEGAGASLAGPWQQVLEKMQAGGTLAGGQAAKTVEAVEQMVAQMQGAARESRRAGLRAAQALAESYAAMVSGVLIGMSDALRQGAAASAAAPSATTAKTGGTRRR